MLINEEERTYRVLYIRKKGIWQYWEMVGPRGFRVIGKRRCGKIEIKDRLHKWMVKHNVRGLPKLGKFGGDIYITGDCKMQG